MDKGATGCDGPQVRVRLKGVVKLGHCGCWWWRRRRAGAHNRVTAAAAAAAGAPHPQHLRDPLRGSCGVGVALGCQRPMACQEVHIPRQGQ
jgi:hypothetical protein